MDLKFQRKGLLAFDASILSGRAPASADRRAGASRSGGPATSLSSHQRRSGGASVFRSVASLDLSNNSITALTNMSLLTNLHVLDVSNNKLSSLSGPASAPIPRQLCVPPSVVRLDLSHNLLTSAAPLAALSFLETLSLAHQSPTAPSSSSFSTQQQQQSPLQSRFDASTLALLPSNTLRSLDVSGLGLTTLRHVAHLARLERLNASANQLTSVEDAKEHLAAMGRGGALLHLVLSRNPLCPGATTAPEPLAAALLGPGGAAPFLVTLNGRRLEGTAAAARLSQGVAGERPSAPQAAEVSHNSSRTGSAYRRMPSSGAPARVGQQAAFNMYAARQTSSNDTLETSFTPEFGFSDGPDSRGAALGQPRRSPPRSAMPNRFPSATVIPPQPSFTVDVDAIRRQEMERLLEELTQREAQLRRALRTQQLSVAANAKVARDQRAKLAALVELEEELMEELCGLESQLATVDASKQAHDDTLLVSRITYAV